ncbi:hypothetical protein FIV42_21105 [Persicimonas caeni]|uniref:Uncharacterized protein n=1 Tax=Persicimonas caeni TaxID=2292766 RepID=A0A4Y6PY50_PERCE|nr:hypothetical protein [Persicimonas caeni]QDG53150.1 hypothetical protein FIV42_21105 [Persicimonas caeni]QED34372.1 hypothetical protein FRD00_21100 [Persicimonas caeni]
MLIGFNNDVEYRGKTFHIQTEDHGEGDPRIETQLFFSGAILDTVITSYEETLDEYDGKEAEERIRAQMKASHRSLYKKLFAGKYDELAGLEPLEEVDEEIDAEAEDFTPSQDRVPAAAAKVEQEGEDAILEFQKKKAKNHVSLDKLKDQLANMKEQSAPSEDSEADDVAPTQVIDPSAGGLDFSSVSEDGGEAPVESAPKKPASKVPAPKKAATPAAAASAQPAQPVQSTPPAQSTRPALIEYAATGRDAWDGCKPASDDLSLTGLVENFLGL